MKLVLLLLGWVVAGVVATLYYVETNKAPREIVRVVKVPVEIIKEVEKPVEVVKEIPAKIPQEYTDAFMEKMALIESQKEAFDRAVALESQTQSVPVRVAAYMKVIAMSPSSPYGKAASDRVAQLNGILDALFRK